MCDYAPLLRAHVVSLALVVAVVGAHELWLELLRQGERPEVVKAALSHADAVLDVPERQLQAEAAFWAAPSDVPESGDPPEPWAT